MVAIRISAVLPCYNHSRYLIERINSILEQTRPVDEIIFLDDASTDDSVALARSLLKNAHCPVVIKTNKINTGSTFAQWNRGVNYASGDLIWIAETDDSCDPFFLETLLSCYQQNGATLAWSQSMAIDDRGVKMHSARDWHDHLFPTLFNTDFSFEGDFFIRNYLSGINLIPNASAVIFSRSKYIEAGPANELMRYAGDWLQWIRLIHGGKVCFVNQELNYFRCHPNTTRSTPNIDILHCENLVCMTTALALASRCSNDDNFKSASHIIRPFALLSLRQNKVFVRNMLLTLAFIKTPLLNSSIKKKGGLAYYSLGSLLLLYFSRVAYPWLSKLRFVFF